MADASDKLASIPLSFAGRHLLERSGHAGKPAPGADEIAKGVDFPAGLPQPFGPRVAIVSLGVFLSVELVGSKGVVSFSQAGGGILHSFHVLGGDPEDVRQFLFRLRLAKGHSGEGG